MSVIATKPSDETRMTVLQTTLYQAARKDPERRFHTLYDKLQLGYVLRTAWREVKKNRGSAGIDRQTLQDIEKVGVEEYLEEIRQALREKTYRPEPVKRVHIPKGPGKTRPLGIPTIRDRVVQAAAKLIMEPIFEADFEAIGEKPVSFGFRPGIGPHEAMAAVNEHSKQGYRWVVDADIEAFFDRLDHQKMMEALRKRISDGEMLRLIWKWLKAGYLEGKEYHETDQGSPQGGVISPLLANVYLHQFDQAQKTQQKYVGKLTRYADDFVIQCGTEAHAKAAIEWAKEELGKLGLTLNSSKTQVVRDRGGFDFLGFHHRRVAARGRQDQPGGKETYGVLRWPNSKSCRKFREQIRSKTGPSQRLRAQWQTVIKELALYLRGWSQYFRHGQSGAVFLELDWYLRERVARNLARSQPVRKNRKKHTWQEHLKEPIVTRAIPQLYSLRSGTFSAYRGQAKVRWRAV